MSEKNVAILLTPLGPGAIAVIRVIGPAVAAFLSRHFSKQATAGRCIHGELRDGAGQVLDDIVAVLLSDGMAADLNLHGGPWVVESVQNLLKAAGFGTAEPLDAFAPDSDDIIEREMLAHLPFAKTQAGIRMLLAQPEQWQRAKPDSTDQTLWRLLNPARVAIVGAPNVGKSTLANQLFGQERSITADLPGTTRDWVGELADVDGVPIVLLDTPGVRESSDPIEQSAIALSRSVVSSADLAILVIDPTQPIPTQLGLAASFPKRLTVLNKSDLTGEARVPLHDVSTIATTGAGVDQLRHLIRQRLGVENLDPNRSHWWTQRQRDYLAGSSTSY